MDTKELQMLAEAAYDERKAWEQAGKPWPIWCECAYKLHAALTGRVVLDLLAEIECARGDLKAAMEIAERNQKDADRYRSLRKITPYRFKKIQDASVTDGGDVFYFHADRFDSAIDYLLAKERT